jgi:carbonic anhydrase/acetyltransferase-like protein (isoleucine patch superfamily)
MQFNTSGAYNTAVGCGSLTLNTTGRNNVAVGSNSQLRNTTGCANTAIGWAALACNTTFCNNTAIGHGAILNATLSAQNTVVGANAMLCATCAVNSTVVGFSALLCNLTGCYNTVVGTCAGYFATSGSCNVILGYNVPFPVSTGDCQLAIGFGSGCCWLTGCSTRSIRPAAGVMDCAGSTGTAGQVLMSNGANAICWGTAGGGGGTPATPTVAGIVLGCTTSSNTFLGCEAALPTTTGIGNTAIGKASLRYNTTGQQNTAVGQAALFCNVTGNQNVAVGRSALAATTSSFNIGIGDASGCNITTGCCNVTIGFNTAVASPTGSCQLTIGFSSTCNWLTGNSTKAIKPGAGIIDCASSCGTAGQVLMSNGANAICWGTAGGGGGSAATPSVAGVVYGCTPSGGLANTSLGLGVLQSVTTGCFNTSVGSGSMLSNTTGRWNTAVGSVALTSNRTGGENTAVGYAALNYNDFGASNTAVGYEALTSTNGCYNTAVGARSLSFNRTSQNTAIGHESLFNSFDALGNSAVGFRAGSTICCGCYNVIFGYNVQVANINSSCQLAIGFNNGQNWLTGNSTKAIKPGAGIIDCANSCGTAGQVLMSNGANAICWGTAGGGGGSPATPTTLGTVYGRTNSISDPYPSTVLGFCTFAANTTGANNVGVGFYSATANTTGYSNTILGALAFTDSTTGAYNTAVGSQALNTGSVLQTGNTAVGAKSLIYGGYGGKYNTALGFCAGVSGSGGFAISGCRNINIGCSSPMSAGTINNEVSIYNGLQIARFQGSATSWSFVSDARDKRNIENLPLGLEFIESLQPRKFEWDHRHTDDEQGKPASGFIAQEVLEAVEASDAYYVNLVDTNNPDQYTLAQANLVPILVNAVKELSRQVKELQMYNAQNSK